MNDGDLLLKAILDAPAEDTPRLAYADWLDENGQSTRASFIRVQAELAGMKDEAVALSGLEYHPLLVGDLDKATFRGKPISQGFWESVWRCKELRNRQWELLKVYRSAVGELPGSPFMLTDYEELQLLGQQSPYMNYHPTRGFVSRVTCSWGHWRRHCDDILPYHPVELVQLTDTPLINLHGATKQRDTHSHGNRILLRYQWLVDTFDPMAPEVFRCDCVIPKRREDGRYNEEATWDLEVARKQTIAGYCKTKWPRVRFEVPRRFIRFNGYEIETDGASYAYGDPIYADERGRATNDPGNGRVLMGTGGRIAVSNYRPLQ